MQAGPKFRQEKGQDSESCFTTISHLSGGQILWLLLELHFLYRLANAYHCFRFGQSWGQIYLHSNKAKSDAA